PEPCPFPTSIPTLPPKQDRRTDFVAARGPVPRSSRITGEYRVRPTPSRVLTLALTGLSALALGASGDSVAEAGGRTHQTHPLPGEWFEVEPSAHGRARAPNGAASAAAALAGRPARSAHRVAPTALPPAPHAGPQQENGRDARARHEFYFTRAAYTGVGRGWRRSGAWATDFPKADQQFVYGVRRLSYVD